MTPPTLREALILADRWMTAASWDLPPTSESEFDVGCHSAWKAVHAALAAPQEDGFARGIEAAAQWHDERAKCNRRAKEAAQRHVTYAAAIRALQPAAPAPDGAVPVNEWRVVKDAPVLIYVVHPNFKYARTDAERDEWSGWCVGRWTSFNKGGWVWHGHLGEVTHVAPLPAPPESRAAGAG
jgi:hypothetical protein